MIKEFSWLEEKIKGSESICKIFSSNNPPKKRAGPKRACFFEFQR